MKILYLIGTSRDGITDIYSKTLTQPCKTLHSGSTYKGIRNKKKNLEPFHAIMFFFYYRVNAERLAELGAEDGIKCNFYTLHT